MTVRARDRAALAGAGVGEDGAGAGRLADPHAGVHVRAVGDGGAGDREHQACVVLELAVPGEQAAAQPVPAYDGGERERLGDPDPARPGQRLATGAGAEPEQVAGAEARRGRAAAWERLISGVKRHQHRQRVDEVRCGRLHQDAALDGALVGDVELALGEVAQPAVHELGAPAAGAEGDVVGVDGDDGQAAAGGVERDAGAGDAEADDEDVGGLRDAVEADPDACVRGWCVMR